MGGFHKWGYPLTSSIERIFPYQPSRYWETPMASWKPPMVDAPCDGGAQAPEEECIHTNREGASPAVAAVRQERYNKWQVNCGKFEYVQYVCSSVCIYIYIYNYIYNIQTHIFDVSYLVFYSIMRVFTLYLIYTIK